MRLAADGKAPGLPVPVLGGLHGDVPLEPGSGVLVANLVVDRGISVIIDVSQFESDTDKARFARDFADRFFYRKKAAPSAVHLFIEECQEFVPQNPQREETRMLHAFTRMAKLGRNFGIGLSLISQRPQEVNKKVLNLAELLFAFQLTGPQERKTMQGWIADKGIAEDIEGELPKLSQGEPHVWSPAWLKVSKRVKISTKRTFDASSTPKVGAGAAARELSPIDIAQLAKNMASTIERAKAEDPKELRAEIQKLRRELDKRHAGAAKTVDQSALHEAERTGYERGRSESFKRLLYGSQQLEKISALLVNANERLAGIGVELKNATAAPARAVIGVDRANGPDRTVRVAVRSGPGGTRTFEVQQEARLPKGERVILTAIAQHTEGVTKEQLTVITGYKRSSRDTYLQRISERGYIDRRGERIVATDVGIAALGGDFEPLPTGDALRSYWMDKLPEGERRVLEVLVRAYPKAVDRERISEVTDYKRSSRDTYLQRLGARRLISSEARGEVRASEELFG